MNLFIFDNTFEGLLTAVLRLIPVAAFRMFCWRRESRFLYSMMRLLLWFPMKRNRAGFGVVYRKTIFIRFVLSCTMLAGGGAGNGITLVSLYLQGNRCSPFH